MKLIKNTFEIKTILIYFGIFELLKKTNYLKKIINNELIKTENCTNYYFFIQKSENVVFEKTYLPIFPEFNNLKCLFTIDYVYQTEDFITIFYNTSIFLNLFSFSLTFFLILSFLNKRLSQKSFLIITAFIFFLNFLIDTSSLEMVLILISIIIFKNNIPENFNHRKYFFIISLLYILSSKSLNEFISFYISTEVNYMVIFEIIVLSYVLYFIAESNKESAFKLISFNPLFTVFALVLNKIFFVLDNTSRILFYFLIIYILGSIFLNLEIKLSFKSISLLKSTLLVITTYMFLGFINSDFFIDKIYNILLIFLIASYFLKNKITLKFIDHKSLSIFFLIFLFTQLNIQNILFKENISNMNINNTTTNLNVVQILFDGLPRSAIDELVKENNTVDYHYYSNFYSTGLNTQNILTDMFYGRNIDEGENYYNYYQQLSDSPDNLINKLNSENINTFLITDRFINDVIFGKMSNKFTNRYINRGEDKDIDSYLRFYENNIPNIYVYDIKPPVIKVFNDYVLDMVNIKKYKTKIIIERGPLIAIDNVSKFYDIYEKTKDVGNNYYFVHLQIPHIPFIMDSDCNYIESEIGVFNNSRSVVNGQVNCAKKLIELLLEKITDENTLLIIHGDHSLNELILSSEELAKNIPPENQVIENSKYIKEKISTGLLIRYPKYNYIEVNNKVENNQIIFMTDFNQFISNFYNNPSSNIKNYEKIEVLNLFGGVGENRNDSNIVKKKIDTKDW